jgi:hypothetical protein
MDPRETEPELFGVTTGSRAYCGTARRLLDSFAEAVQEWMKLHEQQFQCVLAGDTDADRFDLPIQEANERTQQAKDIYMAHLDVHGCASISS